MLSLPSVVSISDLKKTNCEYDAEKYNIYRSCYEGGKSFENIIDKILVKREADHKCSDLWDLRKSRCDYINRCGGMLDFLRSAVFKSPPKLISTPEDEYWEDLNWNADGHGRPMTSILKDLLLYMTLYNRAYLVADLDNEEEIPYMRAISAESVDDWGYENGALSWVRIHTNDKIRLNDDLTKQPNVERHRWTFMDKDNIHIYQALSKPDESIDSVTEAITLTNEPHEFGCLPIFEIVGGNGQWVMDRLYSTICALINRESALTWQLDRQAFAQLVFKLESPSRVNQIMMGESVALFLNTDEDVTYVSPQGTTFDEQFKDIDRLTKSFYEVVNALALNAASTQTQNARQSAEAKEMDRDPLETLLMSFAQPIMSCLRNWTEAVKEFRGDTFDVTISGLDHFTAKMEDLPNGTSEREESESESEENGIERI